MFNFKECVANRQHSDSYMYLIVEEDNLWIPVAAFYLLRVAPQVLTLQWSIVLLWYNRTQASIVINILIERTIAQARQWYASIN